MQIALVSNAADKVEQHHVPTPPEAEQLPFHNNPDYALWYGWSEMLQDLTEINSLAQELRAGSRLAIPRRLRCPLDGDPGRFGLRSARHDRRTGGPALDNLRGRTQDVCVLGALLAARAVAAGGAGHHIQQAQTTESGLSCHIMRPYGDSLYIDNARLLSAVRYQNKRIPTSRACYACHTDYAMSGAWATSCAA